MVMTHRDKMAIARMLSDRGIAEMDLDYAGTVEKDRAFAGTAG